MILFVMILSLIEVLFLVTCGITAILQKTDTWVKLVAVLALVLGVLEVFSIVHLIS